MNSIINNCYLIHKIFIILSSVLRFIYHNLFEGTQILDTCA